MRYQLWIIALYSVLLCTIPSYSQNSYIRESVGKPIRDANEANKNDFSYVPISQWEGRQFIFHPLLQKLQSSGYLYFVYGIDTDRHPSYAECMGRIGTVVKVEPKDSARVISIRMDDNGEEYKGEVHRGIVEGIALVADIDSARSKWLNRTLWYKGRGLMSYDDKLDEFGGIELLKFSPVEVVDIVAGWFTHSPVRMIVKTKEGDEGFIDLNVSNSNVRISERNRNTFNDWFLDHDPRNDHKWSPEVWNAIERGEIFVGMISEQARMSWGEPEKINRTISNSDALEQWVYPDGNYLYIENGVVTTVQN